MAKCQYEINFDHIDEAGILLVVDDEILTTKLAHEINNFYSGADSRLSAVNGDPVMAVIRLFASKIFYYCLVNGIYYEDDKYFANEVLSDTYEGWPASQEVLGISILRVWIPEINFDAVEVVKV